MKKISEFLSESFQFMEVKFSVYLNRRVFVMLVSFGGDRVDRATIHFSAYYKNRNGNAENGTMAQGIG